MAAEARTAQLSVRLHERDKERFAKAAESCGMDPSVVARQLVELMVRRLDHGGDLLDALQEAKRIWGRNAEADAPMREAAGALNQFQSPESFAALVDRIDQLERELRERDDRRPFRKV